jgi:hypothetical protein
MHGFGGHGFGKVGIIFKLKILRAARRTFTLLPMDVLMTVKRKGMGRLREQIRGGEGEGKGCKICATERKENKIRKIERKIIKKRKE